MSLSCTNDSEVTKHDIGSRQPQAILISKSNFYPFLFLFNLITSPTDGTFWVFFYHKTDRISKLYFAKNKKKTKIHFSHFSVCFIWEIVKQLKDENWLKIQDWILRVRETERVCSARTREWEKVWDRFVHLGTTWGMGVDLKPTVK